MRRLWTWVPLAGVLSLASTGALAAPPAAPPAETLPEPSSAELVGDIASARFDNYELRSLAGFEDIAVDSGWVPANSPVQLRIYASAANSVEVRMNGEGRYDWSDESIDFVGTDAGGSLRYDVGVELEAQVFVDVLGFTSTTDLLGPFDYQIEDMTQFTPYLLAGSTDRPASVSDKTDGITIASVPVFPDIIIASGNLDIDLSFDVNAEISGVAIEVQGPLHEARVVQEGQSQPLAADTVTDWTQDLEVDATLVCNLITDTTVIIRPHLVISIFGTDYDIAGIDIPIPLPEQTDPFIFATQTLSFERPEPNSAESDGGSGSDGSTAETGGSEGTGVTGLDDGCNCAADSDAPPLTAGLFCLAFLGLGRRRRR